MPTLSLLRCWRPFFSAPHWRFRGDFGDRRRLDRAYPARRSLIGVWLRSFIPMPRGAGVEVDGIVFILASSLVVSVRACPHFLRGAPLGRRGCSYSVQGCSVCAGGLGRRGNPWARHVITADSVRCNPIVPARHRTSLLSRRGRWWLSLYPWLGRLQPRVPCLVAAILVSNVLLALEVRAGVALQYRCTS